MDAAGKSSKSDIVALPDNLHRDDEFSSESGSSLDKLGQIADKAWHERNKQCKICGKWTQSEDAHLKKYHPEILPPSEKINPKSYQLIEKENEKMRKLLSENKEDVRKENLALKNALKYALKEESPT